MLTTLFSVRSSGVGDHGVEGIHAFEDQHECQAICMALHLDVPGEAERIIEFFEPQSDSDNEHNSELDNNAKKYSDVHNTHDLSSGSDEEEEDQLVADE